MLVKLCLDSLEEKVVRALSFFRRPCCLVHIVLWVAVSDCCIYVLNDIGNDPFSRSNMNSDTCNLYKSDIFNMLSDLNMCCFERMVDCCHVVTITCNALLCVRVSS